jgi:hypothetical protein
VSGLGKQVMKHAYEEIISSNIFKNVLLRNILIVSMLLVTVLPLYNYLVIRPAFERFFNETTNDEAVRIAKHLAAMLFPLEAEFSKGSVNNHMPGDIENLKRDFKLAKVKIFSHSGEIIYSSDSKEVGKVNNGTYFHEIVAKGNVLTKGIQKKTQSLEGHVMPVDVVETYLPIISNGEFRGAFEIYYDVTDRKQQLEKLLSRSSMLVFLITSGLFVSILVVLFIENKTIYKRKQAEHEREILIAELQDALMKIKTLRGLLPICSNCKKVRDDKGYWKQIELYVREHSEAEFTHSICPKCAEVFYPELHRQ